MQKIYADGLELQQKIMSGVNKLADNVAATLGPKGRNVILHKDGARPIITKDGVTVANFTDFEDPVENTAAQILKQAAAQTNVNAGDGTTTSTVLARDILRNTQKYLVAGSSPVEIKKGMDKAVAQVVTKIMDMAQPVETLQDIEHVATVSANGDVEIGALISAAVDKAGHEGSILIEAAKSVETSLDLVEGFRFNSGYFSQTFVTNERKNSIEYEDLILLVTDYKIESVKSIMPILELAARESKPLVIVAEQVEGQALAALIMNTVRGNMKIAAVKAPGYGEERSNTMKDLCLATGATFFSRASGRQLEDAQLADFGVAKKIEVLKNHTTIMGGLADWEKIDAKIDSLKSEIKQTDDIEECAKIQSRISRLSSGIAVIKVGGTTEIEMIEKKHRIEDALEAVNSAQESGIVSGGGTTLLKCRDFKIEPDNEDQDIGANIIRKSLEAPIRQMALNSGDSADLIINDIVRSEDDGSGWDFKKGTLVEMLSEGIIDPAKVTVVALQNAVSVSSTLLTTSNAILEVNK
tara:strand:+ start:21020 stop:22594 length:1575 start_codon:yes stop_codon:yes gene_type:complete